MTHRWRPSPHHPTSPRTVSWPLVILAASLTIATVAVATPPAGVVSNTILAQGPTAGALKENIRIGDNWAVNLDDKGQSEFYFQDLVVGPGGRTGWHSHPGLLLITIKEGSVDFYDNKCTKRSYTAGQAFTEGSEPHNALNSGSGNAHLLVFYVIKKGESRRLENPQPPCAVSLGIP